MRYVSGLSLLGCIALALLQKNWSAIGGWTFALFWFVLAEIRRK